MHREYIDQRKGGYYVAEARISLGSFLCAFNFGDSLDRTLEKYPLLKLSKEIWRDRFLS